MKDELIYKRENMELVGTAILQNLSGIMEAGIKAVSDPGADGRVELAKGVQYDLAAIGVLYLKLAKVAGGEDMPDELDEDIEYTANEQCERQCFTPSETYQYGYNDGWREANEHETIWGSY